MTGKLARTDIHFSQMAFSGILRVTQDYLSLSIARYSDQREGNNTYPLRRTLRHCRFRRVSCLSITFHAILISSVFFPLFLSNIKDRSHVTWGGNRRVSRNLSRCSLNINRAPSDCASVCS